MKMTFVEAKEAIGRGALAAGRNYIVGHPIQPATAITDTMLSRL